MKLRLTERLVATVCAAFVASLIAGCGDGGPSLASVKGKVSRGGKPLASVTVTFSPEAAGPSSGGLTNEQGEFVLVCASGKAGAVEGKHKVVLTARAASDAAPIGMEAMMKAREGSMDQSRRGAPKAEKPTDLFPEEYGDAENTPLSYEVKSGDNDFDIVIP